MNENFENDELLNQLRASAKKVRAPKLSDDLMVSATAARKTKRMVDRRLISLNVLGAMALAIAVGISISQTPKPAPLISLSDSSQSSFKDRLQNYGSKDLVGSVTSSEALAMDPAMFFVYKAGQDLSKQGGTGEAYRILKDLSASQFAEKIAKYFDVTGTLKKEPQAWAEDAAKQPGESYSINQNVGKWLHKFVFSSDYGYAWGSYADESANLSNECLIEGVDNQGTAFCQESQKLAPNFPSKSQAMRQALKIFNDFGYDVTEADLNLQGDYENYLSISVYPRVDGQVLPLYSSIDWGASGQISGANLVSVKLSKSQQVETISAYDAVARTKESKYITTDAGGTLTYAPYELAELCTDNADDSNGYCIPKQHLVTVTNSSRGSGLIFDILGQPWLLPTITLWGETGPRVTVLAITDDAIDLQSK